MCAVSNERNSCFRCKSCNGKHTHLTRKGPAGSAIRGVGQGIPCVMLLQHLLTAAKYDRLQHEVEVDDCAVGVYIAVEVQMLMEKATSNDACSQ